MSGLPCWQQTILCYCISILALTLLMSIGGEQRVYARTQRDRRPNREVRISYPKSRPRYASDQRNRPSLQRVSTSPTSTAATASASESETASPAQADPPEGE